MIYQRICVAAGDEYSFPELMPFVLPQDGNSMRSIFTIEACNHWKQFRADMFKANQTDTGNGIIFMQLRTKAAGQMTLHYMRINSEVDQHSPAYNSCNCWEFHGWL